jgi:hypothetical protein
MSQFWERDTRIDPDSAIRDLEKKVHFLMSIVCNNQLVMNGADCVSSTDEIDEDAIEVQSCAPRILP